MKEKAVIVSFQSKGIYEVKLLENEYCVSCSAKGPYCEGGKTFLAYSPEKNTFTPGEEVFVVFSEKEGFLSAFFLFGLPLLVGFLASFLSFHFFFPNNNLLAFIFFIVFFLLSIVGTKNKKSRLPILLKKTE